MIHLRRGAPVVAVAALLVTTLTGLSAATGVPLDAGAPSPTVTTTTSTTVAPEPSTSVTAPPVTTPLTDATPVPDGPPAPDPSPHIRTLLARLQVLDAQHGVAAQQLAAATAHGALAAADASLDQANQAKAAADDALASARQQLGSVAAYALCLYPVRQVIVQGLILGRAPTLRGGQLDDAIGTDRSTGLAVMEALAYLATAVALVELT